LPGAYQRGKGNVFIKEHFQPGSTFKLCLSYEKNHEEEILDSLRMINQFGGFGARSRNGLGCIKIHGIDEKLFKELGAGETRKSFTSFSADARLFLFQEQNRWDAALSDAGIAYKNARTSLEKKHSFGRRQLIAKPLIVKGEVAINDRHAKPYYLHVSKLDNGKFRGQILFLPYNYHKADQHNAYLRACNEMNVMIAKDAAEEVL